MEKYFLIFIFSNIYLTIYVTDIRIDQCKDFYSMQAPSPSALNGFSATIGMASASKTFVITVSSSILGLTVTAPINYEVRETRAGISTLTVTIMTFFFVSLDV